VDSHQIGSTTKERKQQVQNTSGPMARMQVTGCLKAFAENAKEKEFTRKNRIPEDFSIKMTRLIKGQWLVA